MALKELLRAVPDNEGNRRSVFIANLSLARKVAGIVLIEDRNISDDELLKKIREEIPEETGEFFDLVKFATLDKATVFYVVKMMTFHGSFLAFNHLPWSSGLSFTQLNTLTAGPDKICCPTRRFLGYDQQDVDFVIQVGSYRGHDVGPSALIGRFDPSRTASAIAACSSCPSVKRSTYKGVTYYLWGDGGSGISGTSVNRPPVFDHLGRAPNIAVQNNRMIHTYSQTEMHSAIGAMTKKRTSLGDSRIFVSLINSLSSLGSIFMTLSDSTTSHKQFSDRLASHKTDTEEARKFVTDTRRQLESSTFLRPYLAFGAGYGRDEKGIYLAAALYHKNAATAQENEERFKKHILADSPVLFYPRSTLEENLPSWAEQINEMETRLDGNVLLIKLRGEKIIWWLFGLRELETFPDTLFIHE